MAVEAEFHASNIAMKSMNNPDHDGGENHGDGQVSGSPDTGGTLKGSSLKAEEKARLEELFIASRALVEPLDLERSVRNKLFVMLE